MSQDVPAETMRALVTALKSLKFGSIEVVVHDGKVVQIIRTEKLKVSEKEKT
jgi:hypothetical protein